MKPLAETTLFLIDMDGTLYLGNELIDGASAFIDSLIQAKKRYVFLTNNSSKNANEYVQKMKHLGIPCSIENVFTSGMAMGLYLKEHYPHKKVYLLGTQALAIELQSYGVVLDDQTPDIVIVGFDRELTFEKLEKACHFLDHGALFLATNVDVVCPIEGGRYVPDCGSICQMLTNATGKVPTYIGKPEKRIVDIIAKEHRVALDEMVIIGDRIYTDVKTGVDANIKSILVMSGETTQSILDQSSIRPTYVVPSVKTLIDWL